MNIIDEFDIDGSAEEVVKMQDEFLDYLSESKFAEAFSDHIEKLQEANRQLKVQAKTVMQQSNDVSSVLKTKQLYDIEHSLKAYEIALENAEIFKNEKMKALDIVIDDLEK